MVAFPQPGACLCGEIEYRLTEDPLTLYACHCTDCQRQTGASFALSMIVRTEAFEIVRGRLETYSIELDDGRIKQSQYCGRCSTRICSPSRARGLSILEPGTLDDTGWLHPVGHIWTRSAQPWVAIPDGPLTFSEQPSDEGTLAFVRAWKNR